MSTSLSEKIKIRVEEFTANPPPDPLEIRKIVACFRILPLVLSWSGGWAIRSDGQIISFSYDEPYDLKVEEDVITRNMVLYRGSLKYPELSDLVPEKPCDATECPGCGGTGVPLAVKEFGLNKEIFACQCGGLGWLAKTEGTNPTDSV